MRDLKIKVEGAQDQATHNYSFEVNIRDSSPGSSFETKNVDTALAEFRNELATVRERLGDEAARIDQALAAIASEAKAERPAREEVAASLERIGRALVRTGLTFLGKAFASLKSALGF